MAQQFDVVVIGGGQAATLPPSVRLNSVLTRLALMRLKTQKASLASVVPA